MVGAAASDIEEANGANNISVVDSDPLYPMIAIGASTTGSSTEFVVSGLEIWWRAVSMSTEGP